MSDDQEQELRTDIVLSFEEKKRAIRDRMDGLKVKVQQETASFDEDELLKSMNEKHAFIDAYGGKPVVMCNIYSVVDNRYNIEFRSPDSIVTQYSNQSVQVDKQYIDVGRWWIKHSHRRTYETVIFDPTLPQIHNNCYNLYQGLSTKPEKGSWKNTLKHLYKVLCNGNNEKFKYTIKWLAWCLQNPGLPAEVVIILKGKQGAGKGFIFSQFVKIFGDHGLHISNRKHLTGDFNGHLANCVFLFADEAYYPGDKEVGGALNQLITEKSIATEKKRMDVIKTKNCLHIGMATNEEWVIPATGDARRYYINKVEDSYAFGEKSPSDRKQYFDILWGEMDNGGREALVYDLINMDLGDWHPRFSIPYTEEFKNQAMISITGVAKLLSSFLELGEFPGDADSDYKLFTSTSKGLEDHINDSLRLGANKMTQRMKGLYFNKIGANKVHTRKGTTWEFPTLKECKQNFINNISKHYIFSDMEAEWSTGREDY